MPLGERVAQQSHVGSTDCQYQLSTGTCAAIFCEARCTICHRNRRGRILYVVSFIYRLWYPNFGVADEGVIDKNGWLAFLSEMESKVD
jgi:hypothetical protein